jgi:hypothetical protein
MKDSYVHPRKTDQGESPGMEVRDLFAALIAAACVSRDGLPNHPATLAAISYALSDEMIKVREFSEEGTLDYLSSIVAIGMEEGE